MQEIQPHIIHATEKQAKRIIDISKLGIQRGIEVPNFGDTVVASAWLENQWGQNQLELDHYLPQLKNPKAVVQTPDAKVTFYQLNQPEHTPKQVMVYLPSFTTSPVEGYPMLHYVSIAQGNKEIPCISFDYPLTGPSTLSNPHKNKLQITADALHIFLNTYFAESEVVFIGNSQGALTSALTLQLPEAIYKAVSLIALDPPMLRPSTSWQLGYRGFWDAGDDMVRKHFPNNYREVWDPKYIWNIYNTPKERLANDIKYLQRAFGNGRYGYIHDITLLDWYSTLQKARENHSALTAKILFGLAGTINGLRTESFLRSKQNQERINSMGLSEFVGFHGIKTGTHAMMQNLAEMAEIAKEIIRGGLPRSIDESKLTF